MLELNNISQYQKGSKFSKNLTEPSFKGHALVENSQGRKQYQFYLPPGGKSVKVEVIKLYKDQDERFTPVGKPRRYSITPGRACEVNLSDLEISPDTFRGFDSRPYRPQGVLGYRFIVDGQRVLDNTLKTTLPDGEYNIATNPSRPVLRQPRQMYHLMPDNFNPTGAEVVRGKVKQDKNDPRFNELGDIRRNHFNKLGGNINSIIDMLDYIQDFGAERVISTPIFGQDTISNHGYWTTNPYQITSSLGTITDFRKLQTELFKKGMGWIADGAFVNEGLEGIHLKDVMKWGDKSPFYYWFETHDFPFRPLEFGVLPKKAESQSHWAIKIVNGSKKIIFDENNEPKEVIDVKRDETRPTYIQIFDKRLASNKQVNSDGPISGYDSKNVSGDPNAVLNYMDSVQPYKFEVDPDYLDTKIKDWKKRKSGKTLDEKSRNSLRDCLTKWYGNYDNVNYNSHFGLAESHEDAGVTLWVGNKDIAKLRFMLSGKKANLVARQSPSGTVDKIKTAISQVQDNIVQVGAFWTNETDKTLTEYTAKKLADRLGDTRDAGKIEKAIRELAKKGILPEKAAKLVTKDLIQNVLDHNYSLRTAPLPENVLDGIMSYPLDAIEFSPDLCRLFSSPFIKKLATKPEEIGVSRYKLLNDNEYQQEMSPAYKNMDKVYRVIADSIESILVDIDTKRLEGSKLFEKNEDGKPVFTENGRHLFRLISSDVIKYVIIKSLSPAMEPVKGFGEGEALEYDIKKLSEINCKKLELSDSSPEEEAQSLVDKIEYGIKRNVNYNKLSEYIENRLKNLDAGLVRVSKLIIDRTESGLEWRIDAAKDVGDIDGLRAGHADFEEVWNDIISFWRKFNTEVRKYNPKSYTIGEITDTFPTIYKPFVTLHGQEVWQSKTKKQVKDYQINRVGRFRASDATHDGTEAKAKRMLNDETGFTTPTDYENLFNPSMQAIHAAGEQDYGNSKHGNLDTLIWKMSELLGNSYADVVYNHLSPDNHDKPRILHAFSLDIDRFFEEGKAKIMAEALIESVNGSALLKPEQKKALNDAIGALSSDKAYNDHFGTRPFNQNWKDITRSAGLDISKKAEDDVHKRFLGSAMAKYKALLALMVILPCNPTIYAGTELGETGYETRTKNFYVNDRNRLHWEWLDDKDFVRTFNQQVQQIFNLRRDSRLSPLVNGSTVVLDKTGTDNQNAAAIYRYNADKDVIVLINTSGYNNTRQNSELKPQNITLDFAKLPNGDIAKDRDGRAMFKAIKIDKDGSIDCKNQNKAYDLAKNKSITMDGPVIILYRTKNFDGSENKTASKLSFAGHTSFLAKYKNLKSAEKVNYSI